MHEVFLVYLCNLSVTVFPTIGIPAGQVPVLSETPPTVVQDLKSLLQPPAVQPL